MTRRLLSDGERIELHRDATRSMRHVELQPRYADGVEQFRSWKRGDRTDLPSIYPEYAEWLSIVAEHRANRIAVERCRLLHGEGGTDYQQWEQWVSARWSIPAGEEIWTIDEEIANRHGILGADDFWLLDDKVVIVQPVDHANRVTGSYLVDDPTEVREFADLWDALVADATPTRSAAADVP